MTESYLPPRKTVSFGDIFDLAFLHDVHVRSDSVALGSRDLPAKAGGGRSFAAGFSGKRWVLAHGVATWAVLITDNCVVDTALAQDREAGGAPKGRLLFAPVSEISVAELPLRSFGRFALPEWPGVWKAGAAELRRCFMVDARDIASHVSARRAALTPELAEDLEVRWCAFAARRGPLPSTRNCEKLAEMLARGRGDEALSEDDRSIAAAVAATLATAWRIEGSDLEAVADAHTAGEPGTSETQDLSDALRDLASRALDAAERLDRRAGPP